MAGAWNVAVTALDGTALAILEPDSLAWTRRWCGGAELAFRIPTLDPNAGQLLIAERVIAAYQDGVLRFKGRIHTPLRRDQDWITVRAADPWFDLPFRRIVSSSFQTYTATDAGAIAYGIIHSPDDLGTSPTRIVSGTIATSVTRTVTFELGTSYADAIQRLAEMENGFGFRFDPVTTAGKLAALEIFYPASAVDRPALRFEYGAGTLANLDAFLEEQTLPVNQVRASGSPDATGAKPSQTANDSTSIARYDRFDSELAVTDEGADSTLLFARAGGALVPDPPTTWQITPGATSPMLGRDFDAGDVGRILIRHGAVNASGSALVAEATLVASNESGAERLVSLTLADPAIVNVARCARPPEDRIFAVIEAYRRRLAVLERTPYTGP